MSKSSSIHTLWRSLLALKRAVTEADQPIRFIIVTTGDPPEVYINTTRLPDGSGIAVVLDSDAVPGEVETILKLQSLCNVEVARPGRFSVEEIDFLRCYVPYCFSVVFALRLGRAVSISHFAQTLDGRIATRTGESHWIGNDENLVHAHRMRALCDAILIGRGTLAADEPALTVRRVSGPNPERVVIGSSEAAFDSLLESCNLDIHVFGTRPPATTDDRIRFYKMTQDSGYIEPADVLERLYREGIRSIYVEGGATTTSQFLQHGAIDIMQLHYAPMIMGRGIASIAFPGIDTMADALQFGYYDFHPVGDGYMFVGEMARKEPVVSL